MAVVKPKPESSRARSERMVFRVDRETKALVEQAAGFERRSLTDYCLAVLSSAARRTVSEHDSLTLSARDRAAFFEALDNPPSLDARLERAAEDYARRVKA